MPLFYFSKMLGLAPIRFIKEYNSHGSACIKRATKSKYGKLYGLFITGIMLFLAVETLYWKIKYQYPTSSRSAVTSNLFFWMTTGSSTIFSLLLGGFVNAKKLVSGLEKVRLFDREFLFNRNQIYRKIYVFISAEITAFIFVYIVMCYCHFLLYEAIGTFNQRFIVIYFVYLINFAVMIQFGNFVFLIYQRLVILNERLRKCMKTKNHFNSKSISEVCCNIFTTFTNDSCNLESEQRSINQKEKHDAKMSAKVRTLMKQQYRLREIADHVNDLYGLQFLLEFTAVFIDVTGNLYFLLRVILRDDPLRMTSVGQEFVCITKLVWTIAISFKIIGVVMVCHKTCAECSRTTDHLQHLMLSVPTDSDLKMELLLFSHQVNNRPFRFTAFGFFDIDRSVLCSFVGGIATYLTVLLQFH